MDCFVPGVPRPGGSKTPRHANGRSWAQESGKYTADWRRAVVYAVQPFINEALTGPVELHIVFRMPRPKSHYVAGNPARGLKANAPIHHIGPPDATKLMRSTEDALSNAGVWHNDSQVARQSAEKLYADDPSRVGAYIEILTIGDDHA